MRKVDELVVYMQQEALKLIEVLGPERTDPADAKRLDIAQVANR